MRPRDLNPEPADYGFDFDVDENFLKENLAPVRYADKTSNVNEIVKASTIRKFRIVRLEGKRQIERYNHELILSGEFY